MSFDSSSFLIQKWENRRRAEEVLSGGSWYQWEEGGGGEMMEGEYGANTVYTCM
jgi:hypothetical protein